MACGFRRRNRSATWQANPSEERKSGDACVRILSSDSNGVAPRSPCDPNLSALGGSQWTAGRGSGSAEVALGSAPRGAGPSDDWRTPLPSSRREACKAGARRCVTAVRRKSMFNEPLPGTIKSREMSRKRHLLVPETLGLKRRRRRGPVDADPLRGESGNPGSPGRGLTSGTRCGGRSASPQLPRPALRSVPVTAPLRPGSARAALAELVRLFPRGLFEDALPPIALRSQVYSLVHDRTVADRQLVRGVGAALPCLAGPREVPSLTRVPSLGLPGPKSRRWKSAALREASRGLVGRERGRR